MTTDKRQESKARYERIKAALSNAITFVKDQGAEIDRLNGRISKAIDQKDRVISIFEEMIHDWEYSPPYRKKMTELEVHEERFGWTDENINKIRVLLKELKG